MYPITMNTNQRKTIARRILDSARAELRVAHDMEIDVERDYRVELARELIALAYAMKKGTAHAAACMRAARENLALTMESSATADVLCRIYLHYAPACDAA